MKEFLKSIYLRHIKNTYRFHTLRIRQKKNSVLFISTFENNNTTIKESLSPNIFEVIEFDPNEITIKEQMRKIKRAETIFVDNYYYPLAALNLKNKRVIQIWHAPGAIKKFGLASPKNQALPDSAINRFKRVYNSFDKIVVGSDEMQACMMEAFAIEDESKFIKTGFTRSDYLYNNRFEQKLDLALRNSEYVSEKYTILYMPTFRDEKVDNLKQIEMVEKLAATLSHDFQILYHLHPSVLKLKDVKIENASHVTNAELPALYKLSSLIITDYSSIVFESAVFNTPCVHYIYDYNKYLKHQGLFVPKEQMPGYVTEDLDDLVAYIEAKDYTTKGIKKFDQKWNKYNSASSGRNLVAELFYKKGE